MSACFFFDVREITDQNKVDEYVAGIFATVRDHGGRYVVLGGKQHVLEGEWFPKFPVIVEFADLERARAWYDSPEYRKLRTLRIAGTRSNAVLFEGCDRQPGDVS